MFFLFFLSSRDPLYGHFDQSEDEMRRFVNQGIAYIGDVKSAANKDQKTLIVVGVARGGTSLLAGTLHHMGVFTGDKSPHPVFEDVRIATPMDKREFDKVRDVISEYNQRYNVWAYKRPSMIHYLNEMHSLWRNPIYLFVFRDIAAISNRNVLSMNENFKEGLIGAYERYACIVNFIGSDLQINGIAFSYEKIKDHPEILIQELSQVAGVDVSTEVKNNIMEFITPYPRDYLDRTRASELNSLFNL